MKHPNPLAVAEPRRSGPPERADEAFARELDRHLGDLYRFALFWHEDRFRAEDLVVKAVEEAYRLWRTFPPDLTPRLRFFSALRTHLRPDEERTVSLPGDPSVARGALGAGAGEAPRPLPASGRREVARTLRSLSPRHRELLTLRLAAGLSHEEIASLTRVEPEALRGELARAREALEDLIAAELASQPPAVPQEDGSPDGA